jgi:hypothetical protein|tara:strand:+ start:723 stop:1139 length:417 start_codon:yes stop_codon:yes gene_type:complete
MDNNENVNWDKVNRGKVRYGFALELYKSGGVLKPSEMGKIEGFVDYVMEGVGDDLTVNKTSDEPRSPLMSIDECKEVVKTETEGSRAFVKGMVHMDAEGLKEPDLKRVLDALESGKITMVNLQDSLDRIQSIKDSYKK